MPDLDTQILRAVEDIPGISVLVVFGSRAKGTARPDSDLDVAVLPDATVPLADSTARRRLQTRLAVDLADLAPDRRVDVVFHHLAERLLHLACECVLDTAQHVIAEGGYRQAATYKDLMQVLAEEGLHPRDRGLAQEGVNTDEPRRLCGDVAGGREVGRLLVRHRRDRLLQRAQRANA